MKWKDVVELHGVLKEAELLSGKSDNIVKFRYAIAKNLMTIEKDLIILQKLIAPSKEYNEFEKERIALCELHANKDENGKSIINNDAYDLLDETGAIKNDFIVDSQKLVADRDSVVREREQQFINYENFLNGEYEGVLHALTLNNIPDDITSEMMSSFVKYLLPE